MPRFSKCLETVKFTCYILRQFLTCAGMFSRGKTVKLSSRLWLFLVPALVLVAACTNDDRMLLVEHNVENLDSDFSKAQMKINELEREKSQLSTQLADNGARMAAIEATLDAQGREQQAVLKRLDQIEIVIRDTLRSQQVEMKTSLGKDLADARIQNESDVRNLKVDLLEMRRQQQASLAEINRSLEAVRSDAARFDREIDKVYTEVPKMLEAAFQSQSTPATGGARSQPAAGGTRYTVKPGDTLTKIAADHSISLEALRDANRLEAGAIIRVGQELVIPQ